MSKLDKYRNEYGLLDFSIGTRFAVPRLGKVYKVAHSSSRCGFCAFLWGRCCKFVCTSHGRKDGKNIIFVEVGGYEPK